MVSPISGIRFVYVGGVFLFSVTVANASEKVTLQLRWDHQFQFAGYYAAKWQGYYEQAGFDVEIRSALEADGKILSAVEAVAKGEADFGVGAADIIMGKDKGYPLVVLAVIFQQSAAEFYAKEGTELNSLADLTRLRVARKVNDLIDVEFQAMLKSEGIDISLVPPYPHESGFTHLIPGRVDVMPGYKISVPYEAEHAGLKLITFRPSSYGIDFYGDSLFTRQDWLEHHQDSVRQFIDASLKGWKYALEHPEKITEKITRELPRIYMVKGNFLDFNRFQSKGVRELTLYPIVQLGHMNPNRWRRMHGFLKDVGVIKGEFDAGDFVFDPIRKQQEKAKRIQRMLFIGLSSILALAALALCWVMMLRRTVAKRTEALASANKVLESEIEKRKQAETEIKIYSERLEEMVEDRTKELREAQDQLVYQEKLVTLGQLAGNIAHELRNPLAAIKNAIYFLNMVIKERKEEVNSSLEIMEREVAVSDKIISTILSFARLKEPVLHHTDINEVIRKSLSCANMPGNINIVKHLSESPPGVITMTDADQIEQIFGNLICNAIQAMPRGGELIISSECSGTERVVSFKDTGEGVPEENLEKIFEPLFSSRAKGIGLGLAFAKILAEGHGGTIEVQSNLGKGSTFTVRLPFSDIGVSSEA
ncbi:ABC transporter substrate-binding protein [Desulfonema magnum]|uniref:histidine kinase n=1 Tax=Desulfonema magnum TaxID=45655 RepID=A0A975BJM8_9BACT|nr:ABC transporter substrate-binding protein [Desulfonema magnum]QTA86641.1 Putative two component system response regulator [Desulfonema magnum]